MPPPVYPRQLFADAHLIIGGVTLFIALLHLYLAWRGIRRDQNLPFAIVSLFVAGEAFTGPVRYFSSTAQSSLFWWKMSPVFEIACVSSVTWFARGFSPSRERRSPLLLTGALLLTLVVHICLPYGLRFRAMPAMEAHRFPWGETIDVLVGATTRFLPAVHSVVFCSMAYLVTSRIRVWHTRQARRDAWLLTIALMPLVLVVYPHGALVNLGWVKPPTYYEFGLLATVAVMSFGLVSDTILPRLPADEVAGKERRWLSLLENFSLLAIGCDRAGLIQYVNPYLLHTTGFRAEELLGRPWEVLIPAGELPALRAILHAAIAGERESGLQTGVITRSAEPRQVTWSTIVLRGPDDRIEGTLSVGRDITDRIQAETCRDRAIQELAALKHQLEAENQYLKLEYLHPIEKSGLIGDSDQIRYVLHKIGQAAPTQVTVLIEGETGVGKELVALAIHRSSARSTGPFIRVNCAALPRTLIESELFGHERGSFTGADRHREGRFELADGGTLFLDEIGELSLDVQAKLLRVVLPGELDGVGGTKTRKSDVRLVAATNRNLRREVTAGQFREDLYFRLAVFPITVPPLRERRADIPLLIEHFTHQLNTKHGRHISEIPMNLVHMLTACDWPGNVRELENVIERAVITTRTCTLALPEDLMIPSLTEMQVSTASSLSTLNEMEGKYIRQVLEHTRGRISGEAGAARILGMNPNTLRSRMSKLRIGRTALTEGVTPPSAAQ
jgi:PAS domain S-box-containing protein